MATLRRHRRLARVGGVSYDALELRAVARSEAPADSFELVRRKGPLAGQPFTPDAAPLRLRVKAKRIPAWKQDKLGLVGLLPVSPVRSNEPTETVTLIPMGAARLRITAFPTIGDALPIRPLGAEGGGSP